MYGCPQSKKILYSNFFSRADFDKGPFKYYVSKEVGGWGQQMAIFADLC